MSHHVEPRSTISVKERKDCFLELMIKVVRVALAAPTGVARDRAATYRPAGHALDTTLDPPSIERAEAGNAVVRGFHTRSA